MMMTKKYLHDPTLILKLRNDCLKNDPSMFTMYCDHYAEVYSRLPESERKE